MNFPSVLLKQIDARSTLIQVMAWCDGQTEPILTPIVVTAWRHYATKGYICFGYCFVGFTTVSILCSKLDSS